MTSKKRLLLFSTTAVVVSSVALTLNEYSLETKVSSTNKVVNGAISNNFIKNLNREQILKNINYDSSEKLTPLKFVGSDEKVYQTNTELIPKEIDNKDILLKSKDNVWNTLDSLNEYSKTSKNVKNAFISNLPKELVDKQVTLNKNSAKFLNFFRNKF